MDKLRHDARQSRTLTLIQTGALLQKSGLFDAFLIQAGDNLRTPELRVKAERLLGFLSSCLQDKSAEFEGAQLDAWQQKGRHLLRIRGVT